MEALQILPPAAREGPSTIREGLEFCNTIFRIERDLRDASPAERHAARQVRSRPVLAQFARWLRTQERQVLPRSALGKAVTYCLNQWKPLTRFLEDGRLEVDNNRSERAIKPFVTGRKNWLFANTPRGAQASGFKPPKKTVWNRVPIFNICLRNCRSAPWRTRPAGPIAYPGRPRYRFT